MSTLGDGIGDSGCRIQPLFALINAQKGHRIEVCAIQHK